MKINPATIKSRGESLCNTIAMYLKGNIIDEEALGQTIEGGVRSDSREQSPHRM